MGTREKYIFFYFPLFSFVFPSRFASICSETLKCETMVRLETHSTTKTFFRKEKLRKSDCCDRKRASTNFRQIDNRSSSIQSSQGAIPLHQTITPV